jgi:hypothetical protein
MHRFLIVLALTLLAALQVGCKADDLRKQADAFDKGAELADKGAAALDQGWDTTDAALAWVTDPVNQNVIAMLPATWQARIEQAILSGHDLRPILRDSAGHLRAAANEFRDLATAQRLAADEEANQWVNTATWIAGIVGGTGVAGTFLSRILIGIGASRTAKSINWGREADPDAAAKFFDGPAGTAMRAALKEQGSVVEKAVLKAKV